MSIPSFVIGIAGGTGAGRRPSPTMSRRPSANRSLAFLDNYYEDLSHLEYEDRSTVNYDHPSAFEWELLREQLDALLTGQSIEMPQYDFERHVRTDEHVTVDPRK